MEKKVFYRLVEYNTEKCLANLFKTRKEADDFIFENHLHAYITMKEETMKDKLQQYINRELKNVEVWGWDANLATTRCYGATLAFMSAFPEEAEEIGKWWDDEIHPIFRKLRAV